MESMIGLFKTGLIKPRRSWKSLPEVELATAEWVDWFNTTGCTVRSATFRPQNTKPPTTGRPQSARSQS
ncbi:Integrase core domain-containing protein [Streptomyces mirabilis]|jgi:hypothetical protein|uniref:Integrase core domain-containing protein n=1 Tax=Streptomyces mirabilis TaxID=68239 RepID=A0A1I2U6L6_9ACTN|nr:Integrase core domain-containing protein [Streptomyces mirabilis]